MGINLNRMSVKDSYLLERQSYLNINKESTEKELAFADRSRIQFEKFVRVLELMNLGNNSSKIDRLVKNMEKFSVDLGEMSQFVTKRRQKIKKLEKQLWEQGKEAEEKLRETETQLQRELDKNDILRDQMKQMKNQLELNQRKKAMEKSKSPTNISSKSYSRASHSSNNNSSPQSPFENESPVPKFNFKKNNTSPHMIVESTILESEVLTESEEDKNNRITESQHWNEMNDMNQYNKELLDQFALMENDLMNKEDENKVMAEKLVHLNQIVEQIQNNHGPILNGNPELQSLCEQMCEILDSDFSVQKSKVILEDEVNHKIKNYKFQYEKELAEKNSLLEQNKKLKIQLGSLKKKIPSNKQVAGDDDDDSISSDEEIHREQSKDLMFESQISGLEKSQQFEKKFNLVEICVQMMDTKIESVVLVKQSSMNPNQFYHEEYCHDNKDVKVTMIPLLAKSQTLEDLKKASKNKPESLLVAGVQSENPILNQEIMLMKEIIEKQSNNLRKFKNKIRDLKYDLIEAKDRELKWYGKYMNVQRSSTKKGSILHMSNYKLNGNIDLEASLITIIEANEHLEEETKKIMEENVSIKAKYAEIKQELVEVQRKKEKMFASNESLQKEVDFLKERYKQLRKDFLNKLTEQEKLIKSKSSIEGLVEPILTEKEINYEFNQIEERQRATEEIIVNHKKSVFKMQLLEIVRKGDKIIDPQYLLRKKDQEKTFNAKIRTLFDYLDLSYNQSVRNLVSKSEDFKKTSIFTDLANRVSSKIEKSKMVCLITSKLICFM